MSQTTHTITIDNWTDYQRLVNTDFQNWAFRGQADASWPLFSSLSRYLREYGVHQDVWPTQEERIVRIFRRKAHLLLDHVPDESDKFQWLALMQHHGAPTRLIDFTWSPFVAAFFALERATRDAAVWAVFVPRIWNARPLLSESGPIGDIEDLNLRTPGNYETWYLSNQYPFVTTGEPVSMNKRLIAQSGTFVVPGILHQSVDQILSQYPEPERTITRFVLKTAALRDEAMRALYNMNITNATIFPDLDGLARSMAYELEFHWAFNPKTKAPNPGYGGEAA